MRICIFISGLKRLSGKGQGRGRAVGKIMKWNLFNTTGTQMSVCITEVRVLVSFRTKRTVHNWEVFDCIRYVTVLCCTRPHCFVLHCTTLYCSVLYCAVLCCAVRYCTMLYCTSLHSTVLYWLYCTALYCIVLYYTVLHCTVLHFTLRFYNQLSTFLEFKWEIWKKSNR